MKKEDLKNKLEAIQTDFNNAKDDPLKLKMVVFDCLMLLAKIMTEGIEGWIQNVSDN